MGADAGQCTVEEEAKMAEYGSGNSGNSFPHKLAQCGKKNFNVFSGREGLFLLEKYCKPLFKIKITRPVKGLLGHALIGQPKPQKFKTSSCSKYGQALTKARAAWNTGFNGLKNRIFHVHV